MKLRCIIADDEPLACRLIASYIERTEGLIMCGSYTSASQALDAILRDKPDIAFLDIQMPEINGLEIAKRISEDTHVVFTTAYRDFAVEGFRVNALDYLLKPVSYEEFLEAVRRSAKTIRNNEDKFICVKSEYRLVRIKANDITYIEGMKDYIKIFINGETRPVLTLMSMKAIESALPSGMFMRVHRSYIVNLSFIRAFEQGRVICGDASVPVSDSYRAALLQRIK